MLVDPPVDTVVVATKKKIIEKPFYSLHCNTEEQKEKRKTVQQWMQMTAIIMNSESRVLEVNNERLRLNMRLSFPHFPKDFGEALSVMKVRRGKQLENCCNLAGNVI